VAPVPPATLPAGPGQRYRAAMGTCDSCGREDEETELVRRVYLVVPDEGTGDPMTLEERAQAVPVDEDERWCASCRETFPHGRPAG
jgi:hypothetical protein